MLPRNKKCAVTLNYSMTLWRTTSAIHKNWRCEFSARYNPPAVHVLRARLGADEMINSLHSAPHASLGEEKESYCNTDQHSLLSYLLTINSSNETRSLDLSLFTAHQTNGAMGGGTLYVQGQRYVGIETCAWNKYLYGRS